MKGEVESGEEKYVCDVKLLSTTLFPGGRPHQQYFQVQVMVAAPTQVVIFFYPLLRQITECLKFPEPVLYFLDVSKNNACVVMKTDCNPVCYMYVGGEAEKLEDSCEMAARKVVRDLMKKYGVYVEDITSGRRETYE